MVNTPKAFRSSVPSRPPASQAESAAAASPAAQQIG